MISNSLPLLNYPFNIKKTSFMVIQPRRKVVNTDGSVESKGWILNKVDTTLYVGIHIDKYLSWNEHIDKTAVVLRKEVGLILI